MYILHTFYLFLHLSPLQFFFISNYGLKLPDKNSFCSYNNSIQYYLNIKTSRMSGIFNANLMGCHPRWSTFGHGSWYDTNGIFFWDTIICWIQYRDAIRNQHYFNVRMYRICEYYDVYVSYFRLSYIIFNIYNKNDIFEPKWKITITLMCDNQTYTTDASNKNKYFSRRSMHKFYQDTIRSRRATARMPNLWTRYRLPRMLFGPAPEMAHSNIIKEWAGIEKRSVGCICGAV